MPRGGYGNHVVSSGTSASAGERYVIISSTDLRNDRRRSPASPRGPARDYSVNDYLQLSPQLPSPPKFRNAQQGGRRCAWGSQGCVG